MPQALHPPEGERNSSETPALELTVQGRLTAIFTNALDPSWLEVLDESHQHAGHAGWRSAGETHMRVRVVSNAFTGRSRVERHRLINGLAAGELQAGLHALAIEAHAPGETHRGASIESGVSGSAR